MKQGYIKLYRQVLSSNMYQSLNSKQRDVMHVCLLLANHEPNRWEWAGEIYSCDSGEFITSLQTLSNYCAKDVKIQSVRTALLKLEKWGFLTNKSTKSGRLIKIVKWDDFQSSKNETNKVVNKEPTKSQQRPNKDLTTNKNDKNDKNEKKYKRIEDLTELVLKDISEHYSVPLRAVTKKKEAMHLWLEEVPSRYKLKGKRRNLKITLMNWVRRDIEKGLLKKEIKTQNPTLPKISNEEREKVINQMEQFKQNSFLLGESK